MSQLLDVQDEIIVERSSHKLAKSALTSLLIYPLSMLGAIFLNAILTRHLTPGSLGLYNLLMTVAGIFFVTANCGLDTGLKRFYPWYTHDGDKEFKRRRLLLWTALIIPIIFGTLLGSLCYMASPLFSRIFSTSFTDYVYKLVFLIPLASLFQSITFAFAANHRAVNCYMLDMLGKKIVPILFLLYFIFFARFNLNLAIDSYVLGLSVISIVALFIFNFTVHPLFGRFTLKISEIRKIFLFSLPLTFSDLFTLFFQYVGIVFLALFYGSQAIAIYTMGFLVGTVIRYLPAFPLQAFLIQTVTPHLKRHEFTVVKSLYISLSNICFFIAVPVCMAFLFFGETALVNLFGSFYAKSDSVLKVFSISYLFCNLFPFANTQLIAQASTKLVMRYSVYALLTCIVVSLLLIKPFGVVGVAIGMGLGEIVLRYCSHRKLPIYIYYRPITWRRLLYVFFALLVFASFWIIPNLNSVFIECVYVFCGLLFCYLVAWQLNWLSKADKKMCRNVINSLLTRSKY